MRREAVQPHRVLRQVAQLHLPLHVPQHRAVQLQALRGGEGRGRGRGRPRYSCCHLTWHCPTPHLHACLSQPLGPPCFGAPAHPSTVSSRTRPARFALYAAPSCCTSLAAAPTALLSVVINRSWAASEKGCPHLEAVGVRLPRCLEAARRLGVVHHFKEGAPHLRPTGSQDKKH